MNIDSFLSFVTARRSIRSFSSKPVSDQLLLQLLDCARWAPSGFNLQPAHFVVVTETAKKERLLRACLYQKQILEAPAIVVFTGDRRVVEHNLDDVIDQDIEAGALREEDEEKLRRFIQLNFDHGALGIQWLAKALSPLLRLFTPLPHLPAIHKRYWLAKQVMLNVMNFLLAAEAAGLACSPMEGFDEWRVKYHLGIPWMHIVPMIVAVGYPLHEAVPTKSRLSLDGRVHWNGWQKKR